MSKEITPPGLQWTENIELPQVSSDMRKEVELPLNEEILKIQISDNPSKHRILQGDLQSFPQNSTSLYIPPHQTSSLKLSHIEERVKKSKLISSSNVSKSPFHSNTLKPSKNQDYVWLDPKGKIVAPPTQDEFGLDESIEGSSQDTNVSLLINCNSSTNIRKVTYHTLLSCYY